ncbi:MAG: hypothetical protein R2825_22590 [Saprospiraceae bacterium]
MDIFRSVYRRHCYQVVPNGKAEPDAGLAEDVAPGQLPVVGFGMRR